MRIISVINRNKIFYIFLVLLCISITVLNITCSTPATSPSPTSSPMYTSTPVSTLTQRPAEFKIIDQTEKVAFPDSITFTARVQSPAVLKKAKLEYKVGKATCTPIQSIAFPEINNINDDLQWTWQMKKSGGLPPGTEIEYRWTVENRAGSTVNTGSKTFFYSDNRYNWEQVQQDKIKLFWHSGSTTFATELINHSISSLNRLRNDIGAELKSTINIYVYANANELRGAMIFPQEWTGGSAYPDYSVIAIGISSGNLNWGKSSLSHELAHMLFHQVTFNCFGIDTPTWLNEGLAVYAEGELSAEMKAALTSAIAKRSLISIPSLTGSFSAIPEMAYLSYAESYSIVRYLMTVYGRESVLIFLESFAKGYDYNEGLKLAFKIDINRLNSEWQQYLYSGK